MVRAERLISLGFAALLVSGCDHPENYRWSNGGKPAFSHPAPPARSSFPEWEKPSVAVYSFATPGTPQSLTIKDLSDRGQAALIEALTRAGAKPDEIRAAVAKSLVVPGAKPEGSAVIEGTYNRTLVATVTKGWKAGPADRLVWTWVDVRPLNFRFSGYTVVATDNQVLNIEQITNQTTASLQGQLGRTTSDTTATTTTGSPVSEVVTNVLGGSAGATANLSHQYTTTAAINQQYVKLSADILPEELRIYRESERNLDVAGNTIIALTVQVDPDLFGRVAEHVPAQETMHRVTALTLSGTNGALLNPNKVVLDVALLKALPPCDLTADVTLYYQLRQVSNPRSYVEGEQKANYVGGSYRLPGAVIVPAAEVRKPSWRVYFKYLNSSNAVHVRDRFAQQLELDFSSYEQARDFAAWMNAHTKWLTTDKKLRIGQSALQLSSGIDGVGLPSGPYEAMRVLRLPPADLDRQCAMLRLP